MPRQRTFVTPEGLKRIEQQLQRLCTIQRPKVIQQLKDALEQIVRPIRMGFLV